MIPLAKQLLMIALRTAREIVCLHFCTRTDDGPGPHNAHCHDCTTLLSLMESYR